MEFYLERYALSRAKFNLVKQGFDLPRPPSLGVVAGFPHYAPDCQSFGELISEIVLYQQSPPLFLACRPIGLEETNGFYDLKEPNLPDGSVDWMIVHRHYSSRMDNANFRDFFKESNRVLGEDGLMFAFYQTTSVPFLETMSRSVNGRLGWIHDYKWTFKWVRELAHPLKSVLEADIEDTTTFGIRFGLTVLAKQSNPLPPHEGFTYGFDLESYPQTTGDHYGMLKTCGDLVKRDL